MYMLIEFDIKFVPFVKKMIQLPAVLLVSAGYNQLAVF